MADNPIYLRLIQHTRLPSVRVMLWAGFGVGLVVLAVTLYETLQLTQEDFGPATRWLLLAELAILVIGPLVVAAASGAMVGRDSGSEDYAMVLMTPLTAREIVRGYMLASLARMRVLLALWVGLLPTLMVGIVQFTILIAVAFYNVMNSYPTSLGSGAAPPQTGIREDISGSIIISLLVLIWSSGLPVLGAALGVLFGLRLRRPGAGAGAAAGTLAGLTALSIALIPTAVAQFSMGDRGPLIIIVLETVMFYGITAWILRAAQAHARRADEP